MKTFVKCALLTCLLSLFVFGELAEAAVGRSQRVNVNTEALKTTAEISNQSGVKLVADFYATSKDENAALSPPSIIATYAALAHVAKGKTKEDLHKILSFDGSENLAFHNLNNYLQANIKTNYSSIGEKSCLNSRYDSLGYFLVKSGRVDSNSISPREILERYGTTYKEINFSEAEARQINAEIAQLLTKGMKMNEWEKEELDCNIVKAGPLKTMNVLTAVFFQEGWNPEMQMASEWRNYEQVERPFNLDAGKRIDINYLVGKVKSHKTVMVNNQSGYRIPLNKCDLTIVKCQSGAVLKQLASVITREGLQVQEGRQINQTASLFIPPVVIDTEFDFAGYAKAKGYTSPFTEGVAEYVLGRDVYCSDAKSQARFEVDKDGFTLRQVTFAESVEGGMDEDQRTLPTIMMINSPYMILLTDKNLGTVLGMAFIANPVTWAEGDFEIGGNSDSQNMMPIQLLDTPYDPTQRGISQHIPDNNVGTTRGASVNTPRYWRLTPGDIILAINGENVTGRQGMTDAINRSPQTMYLTVRDTRGKIYHFETVLSPNSPRFGIYTADHRGGGARVTSVIPGSSATRCILIE